jgi:serine/threonine protein kinase
MDPEAPLIGATVGNYRVMAKLGEGGMGIVYLAEHPLIGKRVALKVLHEEHGRNPEIITRFFNEARAVNEIGHPNIVDILDYGVVHLPHGGGFVYIIMEYLAGEPLARLLLREAPLAPERALAIAGQVAEALAAAHQKGVVHRDLKPDNIIIGAGDRVKVLDFGIAKLTNLDGAAVQTRTGVVLGTPAYMSPEQCEGRRDIDARTDIYALGILLYEMMTGRVPFYGDGYGDVMVQHLTKRPMRPSTLRGIIPPAVEAVVMVALEKRRDDRFGSMEELAWAMRDPEAFAARFGGVDALLPPAPPSTQAPTLTLRVGGGHHTTLSGSAGEVAAPERRSRAPLWVAGSVLLLAVGIGLALAVSRPPAPLPIEPARAPIAAPDASPHPGFLVR